jgi:hypothetical protein
VPSYLPFMLILLVVLGNLPVALSSGMAQRARMPPIGAVYPKTTGILSASTTLPKVTPVRPITPNVHSYAGLPYVSPGSALVSLPLSLNATAVAPVQLPNWPAWNESMSQIPAPGAGCFVATYPSTVWQPTQCVAAPLLPLLPSTVGNGYDEVARSPSGTLIGSSFGSFQSINGLTSETDSLFGANEFGLQVNPQFFPGVSTTYTDHKSGYQNSWEQFVFINEPSGKYGTQIYIQYWLINYHSTYGSCPSTHPPNGNGWFALSRDCYANSPSLPVPTQTASNLANLILKGYANFANSNDEVVFCVSGGNCYAVAITDQVVNLYQYWQYAEFNVFGLGSLSQANFNSGTTITVVNTLKDQSGNVIVPSCVITGYTGETNNLNLGSCSSNSNGQIVFTESIPNSPPTISSLTPDKASPQPVGTTITWTCSAGDPDRDLISYEFWLQAGTGPWVGLGWQVGDLVPTSIWSWTPTVPGTYNIGCWVRDGKHAGPASFDDRKIVNGYIIQQVTNSPPTVSALSPDKASPQPVGTTINWTCSATDPDAGDVIQYRFWLQAGSGAWVVVQDWSSLNTWWWSWTPTVAGTYNVGCWVRDGHHAPSTSFDDRKIVNGYIINQEVQFLGTVLSHYGTGVPGSQCGWYVRVDSVSSGPLVVGQTVLVWNQAVSPSGTIDPNIVVGESVTCYGQYYSRIPITVTLVGSWNYYLKAA